jgi:hypothetical protein
MCMSAKRWSVNGTLIAVVMAGGLWGCSSPTPEASPEAIAESGPVAPKALEEATAQVFDDSETHADQAPHGGTVVPLGAHDAHAELVAVPDLGELSLYMLDGEGQAGQRIAQPKVVVDVETSGRLVRLEMSAVPNDGTGERSGDASHFVVRSEDLIRMADAKVTLRWIGVNGVVYNDVVVDLVS